MLQRSSAASRFLLLLIAVAAATWNSFFLVADARALQQRPNQPNGVASASCVPHERETRAVASDPAGRLASWQEEDHDCCCWRGVRCSNIAPLLSLERLEHLDLSWNGFQEGSPRLPGSLRYLNLSNTGLGVGGDAGMVLSQLGISNLSRLQYLDLSNTWPEGVVPPQLSNLSNLEYLDTSKIGFYGVLPPQLGNLSKLQYLDISGNDRMNSSDMSWVEQLQWLGYLDLGKVDLSKASNWAHAVNMVPSLRVLVLYDCKLACANQSLPYVNVTKLESLDLSANIFNHTAASCWFWNLTSLEYLNLRFGTLLGQVPDALAGMSSLQILDFSVRNSVMMLPCLLRSLCDLEILNLEGSLSSGNMTELIESLQMNCSYQKIQELNLAD
uniref:Leucine-rich repeat-containing N-terminal plant-type domain-containing protein n=1 Tax=Setaria viridis TaxID=4556 RepID=A0A4U6VF28_SETVI|nr:hypothetical protein SEVIR_4G245400v2 [Setaria viridis]